MSYPLPVAALLVGVGTVALMTWLDHPVGVLAALGLALVAGVLGEVARTRRLRRLADEAVRWVREDDFEPIEPRGSRHWRQLQHAVSSLGAAHRRRGVELERERPWRGRVVDALSQPALLFSSGDRMLAANDAARHLLQIPSDATNLTVVAAVGSAALAEAVRDVRTTRLPVTVELDQPDRDLRAEVSVVGEETLLVIADVTRERQVEELRRNFVVNASHELKTPVTSIQTLAEALELTWRADPERAGTLVHRLRAEAERLARLVHDLLDLRRLEERAPLQRAPVQLAELVRRTVAELIAYAESREVALEVDAPDEAVMAGVADDLAIVVKNLVSNAVQYNRPGGSVLVSLEPRGQYLVLRVVDTGIGIPPQDLDRIFERFYRVDTARSRETGGTGLGLSIVRHAVESHGGRIEVESALGQGTSFSVSLPVGPA